MRITGTDILYYHICKRQLWFHTHYIRMEYSSDRVQEGKEYHKQILAKEPMGEVFINDTIMIDALKQEGEEFYVIEIKKSASMKRAHLNQLLYYLWFIKKNKGISLKGKLIYVDSAQEEIIELTKKDEEYIENVIREINKIKMIKTPPPIEKKPFCEKCSYYELCYI